MIYPKNHEPCPNQRWPEGPEDRWFSLPLVLDASDPFKLNVQMDFSYVYCLIYHTISSHRVYEYTLSTSYASSFYCRVHYTNSVMMRSIVYIYIIHIRMAYIYIDIYKHIYTFTCNVRIHIHTHAYISIYNCIYTHTNIYTYPYAYKNTQAYRI